MVGIAFAAVVEVLELQGARQRGRRVPIRRRRRRGRCLRSDAQVVEVSDVAASSDGINDEKEESYEVPLPDMAPPGPHGVVVRATDLLGNVATARVDVP